MYVCVCLTVFMYECVFARVCVCALITIGILLENDNKLFSYKKIFATFFMLKGI